MGLSEIFFPKRMWRQRPELKRRYEVVIVGGGSHGLATAYYLAKRHGITRRRDPREVVHRLRCLGPQHDDHPLELPHARGRRVLRRERPPVRGALGRARLQPHVLAARAPDARALGPGDDHDAGARRGEQAPRDQLERHLPASHRASSAPSSTSPSGPRIRSSARSTTRRAGSSATTRSSGASRARPIGAASRSTRTRRSSGFERSGDRITAVETNRGRVECGQVVSATAGWSSLVGRLVGLRLPITTHILQAFVTEPVKPFLDVVLVSSQLHVYVSQTDRGEFLIGAEIEPYTTYKSHRHALVPRVLGGARDRAPPAARAHEGPAHVDGALRPLAGLQPDPRQDGDRQLPRLDGVGDVRLQGGADRRRHAGRARREREDARAHRAVRAWSASTPTPSSPSWPRPR